MLTARNISKSLLLNKNYEILIIDVNSLFLFGGRNSVNTMYMFIDSIKKAINNRNLLVVNVIDNGISVKMLRKHPTYKANRNHSIQSNNIYPNKFTNGRSFKYKITRIHKVDAEFPNHLTFYLPGESDFKIGWLLKFLHERTGITPNEILTVSYDKDFLLCSTLSDVLLKRTQNNKNFWCLLDKNTDINSLKNVLNIPELNMTNIFDYFYYLIVNGDNADNIKQLLTKGQTIKFINYIIEKHNKISIDLICDYISDYNKNLNGNDVYDNCYQVDLFNQDAFSHNQKNTMTYLVNNFLTTNNIKVFK